MTVRLRGALPTDRLEEQRPYPHRTDCPAARWAGAHVLACDANANLRAGLLDCVWPSGCHLAPLHLGPASPCCPGLPPRATTEGYVSPEAAVLSQLYAKLLNDYLSEVGRLSKTKGP